MIDIDIILLALSIIGALFIAALYLFDGFFTAYQAEDRSSLKCSCDCNCYSSETLDEYSERMKLTRNYPYNIDGTVKRYL